MFDLSSTIMKIGILIIVFLIIIYAIVMQASRVVSTKRRRVIAINRKIIEETENVLKYSSALSCSKTVDILLLERIISSLKAILKVEPSYEKLKQYIANQQSKIVAVKVSSLNTIFIEPNSEREAIDLARHITILKKILRQEHAQANISTADCAAEEQKLERFRLKLHLSNTLSRANAFFQQEKFHTTQKMLEKLINSIETIENKDEFIIEGLEKGNVLLRKVDDKLEELATKIGDKSIPENATSLDTLFDKRQ